MCIRDSSGRVQVFAEASAMTGRHQTEEAAARWLARRQEPDWCEADQRELDNWLTEAVANKMAYWRLDYWWKQADRIAAVGEAVVDTPRMRVGSAARISAPMAIAASLAVIFSATILYVERSPRPVSYTHLDVYKRQTGCSTRG